MSIECLFPRKWDALGLPEGIMLPTIAVREHNAAVARFEEVCDAYRELELELCKEREARVKADRLIAAAPQMRKALEALLLLAVAGANQLWAVPGREDEAIKAELTCEAARAALRAANGEE